jgi:hypothetical protein
LVMVRESVRSGAGVLRNNWRSTSPPECNNQRVEAMKWTLCDQICGRRKLSWIFICKWMQEIIWDRGSCRCCRDMVCCCLSWNNNQRLASIQQNKSDQALAFICTSML